MSEINWGLLDIPDIGGNALAAFHQGRQIKEQKDTKAAWGAYAANPNDQNLNALAAFDPKSAIALRQDMEKRNREMQAQDLQRKAIGGDPAAMAQLAGIDLDAWSKIDTRQKAALKERFDYIGNAGLGISRLPPEQRAAAWDAAIDQGVQQFPELAQQRGKYSEQALRAEIAKAGMMSKFIELTSPDTINLQAGAGLYERDPATGVVKEVIRPNTGGAAPFTPVGEPGNAPPPSAVAHLKQNPALRDAFDAKYGAGASARALGGAGSNASGGFLGDFRGLSGERVTSGYRSASHNAAVGGVGNSFHKRKDAQGRPLGRDSVPPPGMSMAAYHAQLVRMNPDKDVINEGDHVHMEPKGR